MAMGSEGTEWWGANGDQGGPCDAGTATLTPQGIITGWSEGTRRLLGYPAAEAVGHTASGLLTDPPFPDTAWCSMTGRREWSGTAALRHRDGHRVDLTLGVRRRLDDDSRPQEYLVTSVPHSDGSVYDWPRMLDWGELVINAIRYGSVPIGLWLIRAQSLICEVCDANSAAPHPRRARVHDEGGRGLHMVAQLACSWGTRQTAVGKTIGAKQSLPTSRPWNGSGAIR